MRVVAAMQDMQFAKDLFSDRGLGIDEDDLFVKGRTLAVGTLSAESRCHG